MIGSINPRWAASGCGSGTTRPGDDWTMSPSLASLRGAPPTKRPSPSEIPDGVIEEINNNFSIIPSISRRWLEYIQKKLNFLKKLWKKQTKFQRAKIIEIYQHTVVKNIRISIRFLWHDYSSRSPNVVFEESLRHDTRISFAVALPFHHVGVGRVVLRPEARRRHFQTLTSSATRSTAFYIQEQIMAFHLIPV